MNSHTFCNRSREISEAWMVRARAVRIHQSLLHFFSIRRFMSDDNAISSILENSVAVHVADTHHEQDAVTFGLGNHIFEDSRRGIQSDSDFGDLVLGEEISRDVGRGFGGND